MANLVSNYKNFKGESAQAKMAILDGTSTTKHALTTLSGCHKMKAINT